MTVIPAVDVQRLPELTPSDLPGADLEASGQLVKDWTPVVQVLANDAVIFTYSARRGNHTHARLTVRVHRPALWQRLWHWLTNR